MVTTAELLSDDAEGRIGMTAAEVHRHVSRQRDARGPSGREQVCPADLEVPAHLDEDAPHRLPSVVRGLERRERVAHEGQGHGALRELPEGVDAAEHALDLPTGVAPVLREMRRDL